MKKGHRALVGACAAVATLAFAGTAFASYAPKLVVSSTGGGGLGGPARIGVVVGASDDPTAKTTIYVPTGYTVGNPAPGTDLGKVTATAAAADLGGAVLPLTGELLSIAPNPTTQAQAQQCGVTPTQTWDLHLSTAGQVLDIPMFVVSTVGPEAASGYVAKLVVCLPPPDVPVGTPGRSVLGAKLLSATFASSAIAEPTAAGDYRWTSLWTPYVPTQGKANAAGSVEVQSIRHLPVALSTKFTSTHITLHKTVRVKGKKKVVKVSAKRIRATSTVRANGAAATATFTTTAAGRRIGGATGTFTVVGKKAVRVVVTARADSSASVPTGTPVSAADLFYRDLGATGCTPSAIFQGLPCIDATVGGETLIKVYSVR